MGKKISYGINIYIYIYMYIRIAFSIELRLRVSRSLRSLANKMNVHEIPAFTQNFSIKLTCCVPEAVMMLYVL